MCWGRFVPSGTGCLESLQGTIMSQKASVMMEQNVWTSFRRLETRRKLVYVLRLLC